MRLCIVVVQSLSRVQLLATSRTAACEAPLSSTISLQKCCQTQCLPKVNRTLMISPMIWPVCTGLACWTISSVAPAPCSYAVRPAPLHPSLSLLAGHGAWVCLPHGCWLTDWRHFSIVLGARETVTSSSATVTSLDETRKCSEIRSRKESRWGWNVSYSPCQAGTCYQRWMSLRTMRWAELGAAAQPSIFLNNLSDSVSLWPRSGDPSLNSLF